jgi:hypothetical protein
MQISNFPPPSLQKSKFNTGDALKRPGMLSKDRGCSQKTFLTAVIKFLSKNA